MCICMYKFRCRASHVTHPQTTTDIHEPLYYPASTNNHLYPRTPLLPCIHELLTERVSHVTYPQTTTYTHEPLCYPASMNTAQTARVRSRLTNEYITMTKSCHTNSILTGIDLSCHHGWVMSPRMSHVTTNESCHTKGTYTGIDLSHVTMHESCHHEWVIPPRMSHVTQMAHSQE